MVDTGGDSQWGLNVIEALELAGSARNRRNGDWGGGVVETPATSEEKGFE